MVFETSHGIGQKRFSPDLNRGKWEKSTDYIFACLGLGLKMDAFDFTYYVHKDMGILGVLVYFLCMVLYLVPVIAIHSFMGQFSSSGFISAFRLSPFFKGKSLQMKFRYLTYFIEILILGMGYLSVFLSLSMLTYYSIYAAIPLLFIINSFKPTLPWACEGLKSWYNESYGRSTICNQTINMEDSKFQNNTKKREIYVPSLLYFDSHYDIMLEKGFPDLNEDYELSWHFVGLFAIVWAMVALIFYEFSETAKFGKFIRYMVVVTLVLLLVCFVRFLFLPGALSWLGKYIAPKPRYWSSDAEIIFGISLRVFGAGWGSVIALSSFNGFKTNIMSYSWIICFGQTFIFILFSLISFMLEQYFKDLTEDADKTNILNLWGMTLSSASALSSLGWPNLWTFIYYTTLLMAALISITTQIFTVLQSLFDEFEELRVRKQEVTFSLIGGLSVCSVFFCSNHGISFFCAFYSKTIFLHLLLLLVVLWIYGAERLQRDILFMLGQTFASWKIYILRFIAPIYFVYCLPSEIDLALSQDSFTSAGVYLMSIILVWLPILAIPGYGIYCLAQSTGTVWDRLRRTCRPTDWYPVDLNHRQQYEEAVGNIETHQLVEVTDDIN
ncbi:sodium- and chloride-dependent neutral and basic amino acid transporter B(0+)-like [Drosophila takahashii]|uniref:sodium- and chloride-dependent neutral and basic amino acid transporter B(0+)-like n=1 Tax=Drosophila takahashii TaxID=29030 RepID=UPI001CF85ED0|nr:sodium- and chloride-dependent neutral and basic amino acid transporter B(0+)-like [Drosophila takahashii]